MKRKLVLVLVIAFGFFLLPLFFAPSARADEVAPTLEGPDLRVRAETLLKKLVAARPEKKIRGVYAAFEPDVSDPSAQVACDDDGDYVVVVSDAMLRLVSFVARLSQDDARDGTKKVQDYAEFLVLNQRAGKRLLPPPVGAYAAAVDRAMDGPSEDAWNAMMLFVYARELAHLRAGDVVCSNPTTTKERGDDEWTVGEQQAAAKIAKSVYPSQAWREREKAAIDELYAMKRDESGALSLLRFFARVEDAMNATPPRVTPSYLTTHPHAGRSEAHLAWIAAHRDEP